MNIEYRWVTRIGSLTEWAHWKTYRTAKDRTKAMKALVKHRTAVSGPFRRYREFRKGGVA